MPRKRSAPSASPGIATPSATPALATPGPRPSLLERLRIDRAHGFHTEERERLMQSEMGRQAYAEARQDLRLSERILLFERVVEEALQAYRHQALALSLHGSERGVAAIAHHKALLAPLIPEWLRVVAAIQSLPLPADDEKICRLRDVAVRELHTAASRAGDGDAQEAARAWFEAKCNLGGIAGRLRKIRHGEDAARWTAMAEELGGGWPSASAMESVITKHLSDAIEAGERTQDLKAIARWLAPDLGQQCVKAGLDPTVLREVGNT